MRNLSLFLLLPVLLFAQWQGWNTHQKNKGWEKSKTAEVDTITYLLDRYPGAFTAQSFRLLDKDWADSSCVRIRRSSDNAEQNFGFVNAYLDTTSLLSFVGAGNGFLVKWYDQTGNNCFAAAAADANEPMVISSGVFIRSKKIAVNFDGTDDALTYNIVGQHPAISGLAIYEYHVADGAVVTKGTTRNPTRDWDLFTNGTNISFLAYNGGTAHVANVGYSAGVKLSTFYAVNGKDIYLAVNGSSATGTTLTAVIDNDYSDFNIGGKGLYTMDGNIVEIILYATDKSATIGNMHLSTNAYYVIY